MAIYNNFFEFCRFLFGGRHDISESTSCIIDPCTIEKIYLNKDARAVTN